MKFEKNLTVNRYIWAQQTLKSILDQNPAIKTVFDVGSRDEILYQYCEELSINYQSFDLAPLADNSRQWDIENPFPYDDPQADLITFLEVIEHLNNPWISIKNIAGVLKKDGYLLLTTPSPAWSNSRLNLLMKGNLSCFTQNDLDNNHHVFTPWPHIVEKLLHDNGFKIVKAVTIDGNTKIFDQQLSLLRFPLQIVYRLIKKLIEVFDHNSSGMSYAILAQKV
ncbi:class I SAM-dependent methyltransferase [Mucilaginibacter glaciei]|uniref:Methyltransferase domain-containing protein n=1 Tax=Mucilaginibacter glaciei TaxID=2772109 RepID=A0A926NU20_9SPHI|nr:methyltransferase domain-containing protein [Mucilaginibacter glaciei]MBD1394715.1 methyltransferase domain-containing protein [Mucilaginibacter glaciei]